VLYGTIFAGLGGLLSVRIAPTKSNIPAIVVALVIFLEQRSPWSRDLVQADVVTMDCARVHGAKRLSYCSGISTLSEAIPFESLYMYVIIVCRLELITRSLELARNGRRLPRLLEDQFGHHALLGISKAMERRFAG
jgi:hypothetical protein